MAELIGEPPVEGRRSVQTPLRSPGEFQFEVQLAADVTRIDFVDG